MKIEKTLLINELKVELASIRSMIKKEMLINANMQLDLK